MINDGEFSEDEKFEEKKAQLSASPNSNTPSNLKI